MSVERKSPYASVNSNLDEENFRNLIYFYEPELRRIMNGESVKKVLGYTTRRKFRRLHVFKVRRGSNHLSEKTLRILYSEAQQNS